MHGQKVKPLDYTGRKLDPGYHISLNAHGNHVSNITHLGWDGASNTTELLDSTIEIVSVAGQNAHHKLHIRLHTEKKKYMNFYGMELHCKLCSAVSDNLNTSQLRIQYINI